MDLEENEVHARLGTSKLAGVFLLHGCIVQKAHGDCWLDQESVQRIELATPFFSQTLHEDADNGLCQRDHLLLVFQDDVLELLSRKIRPKIWAGQKCPGVWVICWDLSAYNECLESLQR